jgi:GAF domain-containing protein
MAHTGEDAVRVAETFGEVARALAAHSDVESILDRIVHLAVEHLDACEFAGITKIEKRSITSPASTGDVPKRVDEIQAETDEGPCLDAIKQQEVFETGDLGAEERWPNFAVKANDDTGISSILSVRLFIEEDTLGALNLYSRKKDAFDDSDAALGAVFAAHAAAALQSSRREQGLEAKAQSRDLIGRAKGILMARSNITDDEAFTMLRQASQRMNIKVRDVADRIAEGKLLYEE